VSSGQTRPFRAAAELKRSWISWRQPAGRTIDPEGYGLITFKAETEREDDGCRLAEVLELPELLTISFNAA